MDIGNFIEGHGMREKECYCHRCRRWFHWLGITRHRAMHRDKKQDVTITYTNGVMYTHKFS